MGEISQEDANALINDFGVTVATLYYDAFNNGFRKDQWTDLVHDATQLRYRYREELYGRLAQMLAASKVDRYTQFLRPEELTAMMKYDVSGVGLNLSTAEEFRRSSMQPLTDAFASAAEDDVVVVAVVVGSLAEGAGVKVGDVLEQVDGQPVRGRAPFQVMSLIHGDGEAAPSRPEPAALWIRRAIDGRSVPVTIPRPESPTARQPVETALRDERYGNLMVRRGYISLTDFNSRSPAAVREAIVALDAAGADEFVLDLRGNPGGLAQDAVEIAGLFLGGDRPITYTVSNTGSLLQRPERGTAALTDKPLIVRVNVFSASASEILAAALRDNCRAPLVGTRTFGKAVIQGIYQFSDGSGVKMTIGKYLTPLGRDITRKGLDPDFFLLPSPEAAKTAIGGQCAAALAAAAPPQ